MKNVFTASIAAIALSTSFCTLANTHTQQASAAMEHAAASIRQAYALAPAEMTLHCGHVLTEAATAYPGGLDIERIQQALCSPASPINLRVMLLKTAEHLAKH